MDELEEANISAAAGKQGRAMLFHTWINITYGEPGQEVSSSEFCF